MQAVITFLIDFEAHLNTLAIIKVKILALIKLYMNYNLSVFGFMDEFWTIPIANMAYTRSQTYTNMMVGKHGIQTLKIMVIMLLLLL
jgi:hypothetical protein